MATRPTLAEIIGYEEENEDVWLPGVTKYTVTLEDIDGEGSTRSEAGVMHREIIRSKVIHAQVQHIVDQAELKQICAAVQADSTVELTVFCPARAASGSISVTSYFYVSMFTFDLIRLKEPSTGTLADWWQVDYTLVEV